MGIKKVNDNRQLSLFENEFTSFDQFNETFVPSTKSGPSEEETKELERTLAKKAPSVVDFVRARFEANPNMDPEEYKRWIKILINSSLKRM
jgi:hypothetical protein